jgi:chitinase
MLLGEGMRVGAPVGCGLALAAVLTACGGLEADDAPGNPPPKAYPYIEVTSTDPQDLVRIRASSRADGLTLAFLVAGPGCRPVWSRGGLDAVHPAVRSRITALRRTGDPVRISFGGAGGTDLASACDSVEKLTAAYRSVVDAYQPEAVDFDVEGRTLADHAGNTRRVAAIRAMQQAARTAGRQLPVSFTVPAGSNGVPPDGVRLLRDSAAAGITVSVVNVMVMNYGWGVDDLGDEAVRQARLAHDLVRRLWPDLTDHDAWQRVALTAMVGRNDVTGETFHPEDARTLAEFATERGVGWLSYWSVERDRACPAPVPQPDPGCSGVSQSPYQFARIFTVRAD